MHIWRFSNSRIQTWNITVLSVPHDILIAIKHSQLLLDECVHGKIRYWPTKRLLKNVWKVSGPYFRDLAGDNYRQTSTCQIVQTRWLWKLFKNIKKEKKKKQGACFVESFSRILLRTGVRTERLVLIAGWGDLFAVEWWSDEQYFLQFLLCHVGQLPAHVSCSLPCPGFSLNCCFLIINKSSRCEQMLQEN